MRTRAGNAEKSPYRAIYAEQTMGWGATTHDVTIIDFESRHSGVLQEPFVKSLAGMLMPHIIQMPEVVRPHSAELAAQ